jgi:uncharacterized protein
MDRFKVKYLSKPKIKDPVLIEGLPGIGNVGKIAIDFLIENIKAKKIIEISSHYFPHSVFINEKNMIDLPIVSIYHKKVGKRDILFLVGDVQPIDEPSCYEFSHTILDIVASYSGKEIITLGGIGLQKIPKKPKIYITGTDKKYIKEFPYTDNKIYGVVGPIIGVTGILIGSAKQRGWPAVALLAQTFAHPAYLDIKGAKEMLKVLNKKYNFKINLTKLSDEIDEIEKEIMTRAKSIATAATTKPTQANYFG